MYHDFVPHSKNILSFLFIITKLILGKVSYILSPIHSFKFKNTTFDTTIQLKMFWQRPSVTFKNISILSFWHFLLCWLPYFPLNTGFLFFSPPSFIPSLLILTRVLVSHSVLPLDKSHLYLWLSSHTQICIMYRCLLKQKMFFS